MEQELIESEAWAHLWYSAFQFKEPLKSLFSCSSQQCTVGKYILSESLLRVVNTCFFMNKVLFWALWLCPMWLQTACIILVWQRVGSGSLRGLLVFSRTQTAQTAGDSAGRAEGKWQVENNLQSRHSASVFPVATLQIFWVFECVFVGLVFFFLFLFSVAFWDHSASSGWALRLDQLKRKSATNR